MLTSQHHHDKGNTNRQNFLSGIMKKKEAAEIFKTTTGNYIVICQATVRGRLL